MTKIFPVANPLGEYSGIYLPNAGEGERISVDQFIAAFERGECWVRWSATRHPSYHFSSETGWRVPSGIRPMTREEADELVRIARAGGPRPAA